MAQGEALCYCKMLIALSLFGLEREKTYEKEDIIYCLVLQLRRRSRVSFDYDLESSESTKI